MRCSVPCGRRAALAMRVQISRRVFVLTGRCETTFFGRHIVNAGRCETMSDIFCVYGFPMTRGK